jgi:glycosyltransferase involved in cell wall biosynthesis
MSDTVQVDLSRKKTEINAAKLRPMPYVSVVIPAYNQAHFLGEAIQSVLNQTFRNFEIIVVDDGSTDDTPLVAQQFSDHIKYIRQENKGLSGARNTAIRHASAEIIALLDSDDLWEPEFLDKMINCLKQNPQAGAVYCGFKWIDAEGRIMGNPNVRVVSPELFYKTIICEGNWLVPCAVVFRKHLAEKVGLFDESLSPVADAQLWTKLSAHASFVGLPEALVRYRRHGNNMSNDPKYMVAAIYQRTEKLFGSPIGDASSWSVLKRCAYTKVFLAGAKRYLAFGDANTSADYIEELTRVAPLVASDVATWRSLARAHLPIEHRSDISRFDWNQAQEVVNSLLVELDIRSKDSTRLQKELCRLRAGAFLALAEEATLTKKAHWTLYWLYRAFVSYPNISLKRVFWGTAYRGILQMIGLKHLRGLWSRQ